MESIPCHAIDSVCCLSHHEQDYCWTSAVYVTSLQASLVNAHEEHSAGRNPEYLEINTNFTKDVMLTAYTLRVLPHFLRP